MRTFGILIAMLLTVSCTPSPQLLNQSNTASKVDPAKAYWMLPAQPGGPIGIVLCQKTTDGFRIEEGERSGPGWCQTPCFTVYDLKPGSKFWSATDTAFGESGYLIASSPSPYWLVESPAGPYFLARASRGGTQGGRGPLTYMTCTGNVPVFDFQPGKINYVGDVTISPNRGNPNYDADRAKAALTRLGGPELASKLAQPSIGALFATFTRVEGVVGLTLSGQELQCNYRPGDASVFAQ